MPKVTWYNRSEYDDDVRNLNLIMNQFKNHNVNMPQEVKQYQHMLNMFYDKYNIKGYYANQNLFVPQAQFDKMSPTQQSEYKNIIDAFNSNDNFLVYQDYEDMFKKGNWEKFGAQSVDDVIEMYDNLQLTKSNTAIDDLLDSNQQVECSLFASSHGMSQDEMIEAILLIHSQTGYKGESLQMAFYNSVNSDKNKSNKMAFGGATASNNSGGSGNGGSVTIQSNPKMSGRRKAKKKRKL